MEKYDKDTKKAVGRGAFGVVYLYLRKEDRREVIIKQIAADDLTTDQRKGVINEIDVSAMFNHPNIIKYHEYFMEEKNFMIVMDYAPGGNLFDFLQQRQQQNMLLEEDEILKFFAQITRALHHIHNQNILHRDMKTHNILLDRRKKVLMICDFGIAKFLTKTNAITTVGTAHYMSPEVVEGKSYNKKSDIWSLGCILYELITLKRAFDGDSLSSIIQKIIKRGFSSMPEHYSEEIKDLVKGILQTDPVKRYDVNQILSQPVLINALLDLETDIGRIPCNYNFVSYQSKKAFNRSAASSGNVSSEVYRTKSFTSWGDEASRQAAEQTSVVYCWGNGLYLPTFLQSPGADQFIKEVCVGRTKKLGLTSNGRVFMWENENLDQSNDKLIPKLTSEFSGSTVAHISCGDHFIVAMTVHGMLMTWGSGAHGCLGHGTTDDLSTARVVEDLVGCTVTKVSCGAAHVLALTTDNQVYVWGNGNSGNLGLNDLQERCNPTLVPLPASFHPKSIFCGRNYSFIVSEDGTVLACGNNRYNKLCVLTEEQLEAKNVLLNDVLVFTKISSKPLCDHKIISIGTGNSHVAFLTDNGLLFMAGSNKNFQLGVKRPDGDLRAYLVDSLQTQKVEHVACGDTFTVAVTKNNKVFTWGSGKHGRLGLGNVEEAIEPKEVIINDINKPKFHSLSVSNSTILLAGQSCI